MTEYRTIEVEYFSGPNKQTFSSSTMVFVTTTQGQFSFFPHHIASCIPLSFAHIELHIHDNEGKRKEILEVPEGVLIFRENSCSIFAKKMY